MNLGPLNKTKIPRQCILANRALSADAQFIHLEIKSVIAQTKLYDPN